MCVCVYQALSVWGLHKPPRALQNSFTKRDLQKIEEEVEEADPVETAGEKIFQSPKLFQ